MLFIPFYIYERQTNKHSEHIESESEISHIYFISLIKCWQNLGLVQAKAKHTDSKDWATMTGTPGCISRERKQKQGARLWPGTQILDSGILTGDLSRFATPSAPEYSMFLPQSGRFFG